MIQKTYQIVIALIILTLALGGAQAVQAQEGGEEVIPPGLTLELVGPNEVEVGQTFELQVVASNIPDPGIFGYQFRLEWDSAVFEAISVSPNPDFPVIAKDELTAAGYQIAASRQGDVADMAGPLTLLTVEMKANVITDPAAIPFFLAEAKAGRKGGIEVPIDQIIGLDVVVIEDHIGDIVGNVAVEGRAADNQAGHTVMADGLSTQTDLMGDFVLSAVAFGTYSLTADSPGFLAATCEAVDHNTHPTNLQPVTLLAGDIDGSGEIDITDAVAIGAVFGSGQPGELADLNADGLVDILDLILMAANYGQTSPDNPWICQ